MNAKFYIPTIVLILLSAFFLRIEDLSDLPPGPHFDESANILITRSIAFDGANLFPIANSYQGRESLYYYLNIPMFRLIGDDVFHLRLTSTFVNLLTIAAAAAMGRIMFTGQRGRMIGLVAAALMLISFHQIFMSRQAYRAVTLPLMQGLGLAFLYRGLRVQKRSWLWLMLGGLFSGGAIYTYMASRLFPVWIGLVGLFLLVVDRASWRLRLRQGLVYFGMMLLVMLPMLIYAAQNQDIFFQRLTEVSEGEVTVTLEHSILRHLEMFFIRGDDGNLRYNVPGRPYFTLPEGLFLLVGLFYAASGLTRARVSPVDRSVSALLLLAPFMILPSVISLAGFPPSHMRSLGMVPLIFVLVAFGVERSLNYVQSVFNGRGWRDYHTLIIAAGVLILLGAGIAVRDSYRDWANRTDLFEQADGDLALAAKWLPTQVDADTRVYVASFNPEHPTIITGWDGNVSWMGGDSLFLPPPDQDALLIFARSVPPAPRWHDLLAPFSLEAAVPAGPDDRPAFYAYKIPAGSSFDLDAAQDLSIQNPYVRYLGAEVPPMEAGADAHFTMRWQIRQTPPYARLRPVIRLLDSHGLTVASADLFLLGTDQWRAGETLIQTVRLPIPWGTIPGEYGLQVAWVDRDSDTYVSYQDEQGASAGIFAQIFVAELVRPQVFMPADVFQIEQPVNSDVSPGIRLLGWDRPPATLRPGERFIVTTYWQAVRLEGDRAPILYAFDLENTDTALSLAGAAPLPYSPERWRDHELVRLPLLLEIPSDQPGGEWDLKFSVADSTFALGSVAIDGSPRLFEAPDVDEQLNLKLGDVLSLYGYSLRQDDDATTMILSLVWQAVRETDTNYQVFVHVLNVEGEIIAQQDAQPMQNAYPTSLWAPDEYVVDSYTFPQSLDAVAFRVGMYLQDSGTRLQVSDGANDTIGDFILIPALIMER